MMFYALELFIIATNIFTVLKVVGCLVSSV